MAENFTQVIARELRIDIKDIPMVKGTYRVKQGVLNLNPADVDTFQKLFAASPIVGGKTVGNGEVSLYWLFNWQKPMNDPMKPTVAQETRGDNQPDLLISRRPVEVKAYKTHEGLTTLGRFQKQRAFVDMVNRIFGVRNIVNDEENKRVDVMNFNFNKLAEAAELFCEYRTLLHTSKELRKYSLFERSFKSMQIFDQTAKSVGLNVICYQNGMRRPGGEKIAYELARYVIREMLEGKPGEGNFIANMIPGGAGFRTDKGIYFHQIKLDSMTTDANKLNKAFVFDGGFLKLSYTKLFE